MRIPHKLRLLKRRLFRKSDGEAHLRKAYKRRFRRDLNTTTPTTFSELLFTRMIRVNRHGDDLYTRLADKFLVREYVGEKIGERYLIELLWSGKDPNEIPFDSLPAKCIAKTNHGSGRNIVLTESTDRNEVVQQFKEWLKENYYWRGREYQYYKIPRLILIEELLDDGEPDGPLDYRFWCFNGKPELIQVDNHLHDINPFYDVNWKKLDLSYRENFRDCNVKKPKNFHEMLEVSAALSSGFDFVRVDLYNLNGRIFFGELTFTPVGGNFVFRPESWDSFLGQKWVAPE